MKKGFDSECYVAAQSAEIFRRVRSFGKLYLEVGGKLCYDKHAARVLPGYRESCKVEILRELGDLDVVYCVSARDLVSGREVGLSGLDYEEKILGDLKDLKKFGFDSVKIVVTMFDKQDIGKFVARLRKKYRVYFQGTVEGYGSDLGATLRMYGRNSYVRCGSDLVVVTGPAGGSGKMGFCLSQLYAERKKGVRKSGFAKFESFPVWNLPMCHPVNLAYEAATADFGDYNVIDKFHLKAYGKRAVNYNRDVENFGILGKVLGSKFPFGYRSVTDMGVNMMRSGIVDDGVCRRAAEREIRRRFGRAEKGSVERGRIGKILGKLARG